MAKEEKTNLYLLAIVAIVAIVGVVVMVFNAGSGTLSFENSILNGENDLTGQGTRWADGSSLWGREDYRNMGKEVLDKDKKNKDDAGKKDAKDDEGSDDGESDDDADKDTDDDEEGVTGENCPSGAIC